MTRKVTVITGLTATGKTKLAIEYAKKQNGVIISADSRQVYKELTIISGKDIGNSKYAFVVSKNGFDIGYYLIDGVQLFMYDVLSVTKAFSSYDFVRCAWEIMHNYIPKDKTIIFVGGTYLYLKHFFFGFDTEDIKPNLELRDQLNTKSVLYLQNKLSRLNPSFYLSLNNSDKNNPHRLIRKIEIAQAQSHTNIPMFLPDNRQEGTIRQLAETPGVVVKWVGLKHRTNELLEKRIRQRVVKRIQNGAIIEVSNIYKQYKTYELPGLSALGCTFISKYLKKEINKQELVDLWTREEIQYAKRQYSFMKQNKDIQWEEV